MDNHIFTNISGTKTKVLLKYSEIKKRQSIKRNVKLKVGKYIFRITKFPN